MAKPRWRADGTYVWNGSVVGTVSKGASGVYFGYGCMDDWQDSPLGSFENILFAMNAVQEWVKNMSKETSMEHIARDIREGRFPQKSEPQECQSPVDASHPMMIAWNKFRQSDEFANALKWALAENYEDGRGISPEMRTNHAEGAMWLALTKGFEIGEARGRLSGLEEAAEYLERRQIKVGWNVQQDLQAAAAIRSLAHQVQSDTNTQSLCHDHKQVMCGICNKVADGHSHILSGAECGTNYDIKYTCNPVDPNLPVDDSLHEESCPCYGAKHPEGFTCRCGVAAQPVKGMEEDK